MKVKTKQLEVQVKLEVKQLESASQCTGGPLVHSLPKLTAQTRVSCSSLKLCGEQRLLGFLLGVQRGHLFAYQ